MTNSSTSTMSDNKIGSYGTGGKADGATGSADGLPASLARPSAIYTNAPVRFQSTIVKADAAACRALNDPFVDAGGNITTPASGCPGTDGDAGLRALADNGGPVATRAPTPGGPAIDANASGCPATDARGFARPFGTSCDAGAYELAPPSAATGDASGSTVSGSVNLRGPSGGAHFEYGTTAAYGSSTPDQGLGSGFGDRSLSAALSGLPAGTTIHYRVVVTTPDGTAAGADRTFQTAQAGPPRDALAPVLKSLKLSPKKFKVGKKVTIGFSSTEAGKATLTFQRVLAGKKVKKKGKTKCVTAHGRVARKLRCKIYKSAGSLKANAKSGTNKITFKGKIGKKKLAAGNYRLTLKVVDAAGNKSKGATATFTVTRR